MQRGPLLTQPLAQIGVTCLRPNVPRVQRGRPAVTLNYRAESLEQKAFGSRRGAGEPATDGQEGGLGLSAKVGVLGDVIAEAVWLF